MDRAGAAGSSGDTGAAAAARAPREKETLPKTSFPQLMRRHLALRGRLLTAPAAKGADVPAPASLPSRFPIAVGGTVVSVVL